MYDIDCNTVKIDDLLEMTVPFSFKSDLNVDLHGFATWFEVLFEGSERTLTLTTASKEDTHWAQTLFLYDEPMPLTQDDTIKGDISFCRKKDNHRCIEVSLSCSVNDSDVISKKFSIE